MAERNSSNRGLLFIYLFINEQFIWDQPNIPLEPIVETLAWKEY